MYIMIVLPGQSVDKIFRKHASFKPHSLCEPPGQVFEQVLASSADLPQKLYFRGVDSQSSTKIFEKHCSLV